MIASWLDGGGGEFIPIAEGIPARAVARLLGLPEEDLQQHRRWAMMGGDILAGDLGGERIQHLALESLDMAAYLREHFERALANPRDDDAAPLLHTLARGVRDERIGSAEALGIVTVLFGAGGESTAGLLGSVVRCLAERPDLAATLRDQPALIPNLVEEVARLEPPFKFHYRLVRRQCELASFELAPGDRLMLLWAAASRDPREIEDPDELRLTRTYSRHHLSFGRGAHFCIGAALARLEARVVCEELLSRTSSLGLAGGTQPVYSPSIFVRRLESLPLVAVKSAPPA
jgi:cytochrome P450